MNSKIFITTIFLVYASSSCQNNSAHLSHGQKDTFATASSNSIPDSSQTVIFRKLLLLVNNEVSENMLSDSISFLIIPIDASCNYCRDKCIDNLIKFIPTLPSNHFAVITGNGTKAIKSYFSEQSKAIPVKEKQVFLDGGNNAYLNDLVFLHPTFYYCYNGKAYEKVKTVPVTIQDDLKRFFE